MEVELGIVSLFKKKLLWNPYFFNSGSGKCDWDSGRKWYHISITITN